MSSLDDYMDFDENKNERVTNKYQFGQHNRDEDDEDSAYEVPSTRALFGGKSKELERNRNQFKSSGKKYMYEE